MSNFNWTEAPAWMPEAVLYTDLSTDEDRVEIGFYLDYADGEINPLVLDQRERRVVLDRFDRRLAEG